MSVLKRKRLDETINTDSFEDRICDDLCEELLRWLNPIEKLNMAGVSKQFKRCLEQVKKRQKALRFNRIYDSESINSKDAFELIHMNRKIPKLIKCFPNIQTIDFADLTYWSPTILMSTRGFFEAVMSCERLKSIIGYRIHDFISEEKLKQFTEKFGKQWQYLDLNLATPEGLELLRNCKSIKKLNINYFNLVDGDKMLASNLEYVTIDRITNTNLFAKFVLQNPNLKSLTLYKTQDAVNTRNILSYITKLTKLKDLKMKIYVDEENASQVSNHFTAIAMKTQLRSLYLNIVYEIDINEFLANSLSSFTTLQEVFLQMDGFNTKEVKFNYKFLSRNRKINLIGTHGWAVNNIEGLESFDSLENVYLHCSFIPIDDDSLRIFHGKKKLKHLSISSPSMQRMNISYNGIAQLLEMCPSLGKVDFSLYLNDETVKNLEMCPLRKNVSFFYKK